MSHIAKNLLLFLKRNIIVLTLLTVGCVWSFGNIMKLRPIDADNLVGLSLGERSISSFFLNPMTSYFPAYRPVAQFIIWMQYQLVGLDSPQSYFLVNLGIWLTCSILLCYILIHLTKDYFSSSIASLAFFLDSRSFYSIIWIAERQNSLSVMFGLSAISLYLNNNFFEKLKSNYRIAVMALLLILSYLSKEYGAAFSGFLFLFSYLNKKYFKEVFLSIVLSFSVYIILRFGLADGGGSLGNYCEDMGYFKNVSFVCYKDLTMIQEIKQHGYNILATFLGTYSPDSFTNIGSIVSGISSLLNLSSLFFLIVIILNITSLARAPKLTIPFIGLVFFSSLLNFMLYRTRNQLVGLVGVYIAFGIGLAFVMDCYIKNKKIGYLIYTLLIILVFSSSGVTQKKYLDGWVSRPEVNTYCIQAKYPLDINSDLVQKVNSKYNLPFKNCQ